MTDQTEHTFAFYLEAYRYWLKAGGRIERKNWRAWGVVEGVAA